MRVLLSGMDDNDVEGELIGGEFLDIDKGEFDLEETMTVRCDDGRIVRVLGWHLDIAVLK